QEIRWIAARSVKQHEQWQRARGWRRRTVGERAVDEGSFARTEAGGDGRGPSAQKRRDRGSARIAGCQRKSESGEKRKGGFHPVRSNRRSGTNHRIETPT